MAAAPAPVPPGPASTGPASTGTIRAAGPDDVPAIAELERRLFGDDAWSEPAVAAELRAPGRTVLVHDDGAVVGYVVAIVAGGVLDLARIAVDPARRRAGIACGLLGRVLATAAGDGAERVLLEVSAANHDALAFYAAAGFARVDVRRRYYRDGSDAIVMRRAVDPGSTGRPHE